MAGITSIIVNLGNNITLDESNNYTKTNCRVQLAHNLPEGAEGVCEIKSGNTLLTSFNYKSPGFIFIGTQKQFIPIHNNKKRVLNAPFLKYLNTLIIQQYK